MRVLARMKRLRGGVFDLFGYTAERRMERELIGWYEALIETMIVRLPARSRRRCSRSPRRRWKSAATGR